MRSLIVLLGLATFVSGQSATRDTLALVGGTVIASPDEEPIQGGVLLVRDGKIAALGGKGSVELPRNVETIDCRGLTVTAGLWNSHAHFFERKWANIASIPAGELARQLQEMVTRYGFTTVFDLGSPWENTRRLRDRIDSGEVPGPRIRSTGEVLIAPGAVPPDAVIGALGFLPVRNPEIADAEGATAAVRKLLDSGVDGVKIHLQPPPPPKPRFSESAIQAAVSAAHGAMKPVFVHPNTAADVVTAARAGVDVIAHTTPSSGPWDEGTLAAMKASRVALTPTLSVWRALFRHDRLETRERLMGAAVGQLRSWVARGGIVLFGTDLGAGDYDPVEEYALMIEAGMTFRGILAALTTVPAERFGASARLGRLASGLVADITVVKGDPGRDIGALASVQYTLRDGRIIYRSAR